MRSFSFRAPLLPTLCALLVALNPARAADEFFFHDGDKPIVFLGDSITEQKLYTTYIEAFVLSRYPEWKVTFRNIGWGGDTAWFQKRGTFETGYKRDVEPLAAKAMTIDFGMNDARPDDSLAKYTEYLTKIVQLQKTAGSRVAVLSPSPEEKYENGQPGGSAYNNKLRTFSNAAKEVAAKEDVLFVDQFEPFVKLIEEGRKAGVLGATGAPRLTNDAVHPNVAGHLVMATAILKGLRAPALVSEATIDAAMNKVIDANQCQIDLKKPGKDKDTLTFVRLDKALPWPIPADTDLAFKLPDFRPLEDLSQYMLRITGLTAPHYSLTIDGVEVGPFSREDLEKGVNLSQRAGPINDQTRRLWETIAAKNNIYFDRWRNVQIFAIPAWLGLKDAEKIRATELARMDKLIADQEMAIDNLRRPVAHTFALKPKE